MAISSAKAVERLDGRPMLSKGRTVIAGLSSLDASIGDCDADVVLARRDLRNVADGVSP
jgi:hypothetical protein